MYGHSLARRSDRRRCNSQKIGRFQRKSRSGIFQKQRRVFAGCDRRGSTCSAWAAGRVGAIDLRTIDRHPLASVGTLVLGLRCSWCPRSAPMPKLLGLFALPARRSDAAALTTAVMRASNIDGASRMTAPSGGRLTSPQAARSRKAGDILHSCQWPCSTGNLYGRPGYAVLAAPLPSAAWAAARRAMGTRNGEQDT